MVVKRMKKFSLKKAILWFFLSIFSLFALGLLAGTIIVSIVGSSLTDVSNIDNLFLAQSTTIYDRNGNTLYIKHGGENRKYVTIDEISEDVVKATIAMEDDQFWVHPGFDVFGIVKAGMYEFFGVGARRGGSTITQQYVKYAFLSLERTYTRKLKELILAIRLEKAYDKNKIIELYLNKIPYGNNAYGVQKAAKVYFAKDAKDLSLAESTILAAIIQAPSYYNPYGENRNSKLKISPEVALEKGITSESDLEQTEFKRGLVGQYIELSPGNKFYLQGRSDLVLKRLRDLNWITEEEKKKAWSDLQKIEFKRVDGPFNHPHIVFHVLAELEEKYGKEIVEQGGLEVYTTIDADLQEEADRIIKEGTEANIKRFNANNASLVAVDNETGDLLAMVGSSDYFNKEIDGEVNIALSYKQPGSSFKPFVYAQSFYNKFAPASVIYDVPTSFGGTKVVQNYDGKFMGPISIRKALGQSRNIPAIKAYFLAGEKDPILNLTQSMGINYQDTSIDYGWPLALGSAEVRLYDMVQAYSVFANNGKKKKINFITRITNSRGDILEEVIDDEEEEEVLDPQIAYLINHILSDTSVRIGPKLTVPGFVNAAKTGTSTKDHPTNRNIRIPSNLWTVGYTPDITTGVWVGNANDRKSGNLKASANGYDGAAGIWQKFMIAAHKGRKSREFPRPEGIKVVAVSSASGKLPSSETEGVVEDLFASFSVPTEKDQSFITKRIDIPTGKLATPDCSGDVVEERTFRNHQAIDPSRKNWVAGIRRWAGTGESGAPPPEGDYACSENDRPEIFITSPSTFSRLKPGNIDVKVDVNAPLGVDRIEYFLNSEPVFTSSEWPYTGVVRLNKTFAPGSKHLIVAKLYDLSGLSSQSVVEFTIDSPVEPEKETEKKSDSTDDKKTEPTE